MKPDSLNVVHVPEKSRYELRTGDEVIGFADAEERDGVVVIPFVKVDSQYSGQGLGARLVRDTLDDIRSSVVSHKVQIITLESFVFTIWQGCN